MGTWGEGPFDNDAAADLVAGLMRRVTIVLDEEAKEHAAVAGSSGEKMAGWSSSPHPQSYYGEARAAAQFILTSHGTDILGGPPIANVVRLLAQMRTDAEWLAGWRDPKKIAAALDRELIVVIAKIRACKGCRRDMAKVGELETLARQARQAPVPKRRQFKGKKIRKSRKVRATARRLHQKDRKRAA